LEKQQHLKILKCRRCWSLNDRFVGTGANTGIPIADIKTLGSAAFIEHPEQADAMLRELVTYGTITLNTAKNFKLSNETSLPQITIGLLKQGILPI
jgi:hypothetical protein